MLEAIDFDRFTMGFSLGVHIILAVLGMALPVIIMLAEYLAIKHKDEYYAVLSKRLTTVFVVFFAVGVASGFLVAINLLFLWPSFMALVSQVAIAPVYLEVFAFFTEAIFLVIYLFYRDVFSHKYVRVLLMGIIAVGGAASAVLITILNSFMNTPVGFNIAAYLQNGTVTGINPLATFAAPAVGIEVPHVLATSYLAGSGIILAYFAYMLLTHRGDSERVKTYHLKALKLSFAVFLVAVIFSVITGVLSIQSLYTIQPEKYAAIELNLNSTANAPEIIGGIYQNNTIVDAVYIPGLQSDLDGGASVVVPGLNQYPQSTWPPLIIHILFEVMVFLGFAIGIFALLVFVLHELKRKVFQSKTILVLLLLSGALSLLVLEFGWVVDEVGRQPWIIYNVMTVSQAANQSLSIVPIALLIVAIYVVIIPVTLLAIRRILSREDLESELK